MFSISPTIQALLARWSQCEPGWCFATKEVTGRDGWAFNFDGFYMTVNASMEYPQEVAVVQLAVQNAIAARKWFWELGNAMAGHSADVMRYKDAREIKAVGQGETACEALLSAYLEAVRMANDGVL